MIPLINQTFVLEAGETYWLTADLRSAAAGGQEIIFEEDFPTVEDPSEALASRKLGDTFLAGLRWPLTLCAGKKLSPADGDYRGRRVSKLSCQRPGRLRGSRSRELTLPPLTFALIGRGPVLKGTPTGGSRRVSMNAFISARSLAKA